MNIPLAWLNLVHEKTRLVIAIAGVAFAVVLVFMNLGFLGALASSAAAIYDDLNADLFLVSPQALELTTPDSFPRERLYQVEGVKGVERTMPLYMGYQQWRNPESREHWAIFIFGIKPTDPVFSLPELQQADMVEILRRPDTVLMDRIARPEYGPHQMGVITEVNRRQIQVGGNYTLGSGFAYDASLIVGDQNFRRLFDPIPLSLVNLGLIKVQAGTDPEQVKAELKTILPADVDILTREEIATRDRKYWIETTSTGLFFNLGVTVALIVGTVILYQILYADITDHMAEYATLKAMGYRTPYLLSVVVQEALILAVMGYIPGLALAMGLYELTQQATNGTLPIGMEAERAIWVFILTVGMCAASGLISVQKVLQADPAEVF